MFKETKSDVHGTGIDVITTKQKWITIAVFLLVLLLSTAFGIGAGKGTDNSEKITSEKEAISSVKELSGKALGGMAAKMPDASAKIFFESQFGVKFSAYRSYDAVDTAVKALKQNQVQAIWASDVTADWLLRTEEGLQVLHTENGLESVGIEDNAAGTPLNEAVNGTGTSGKERMQFALAFRPEDEAMRDLCNERLAELKENGKLADLLNTYVWSDAEGRFYPEQMTVNSETFSVQITGKPVYIGITGSVPPLECVDERGVPYGFCVALSDLLAQKLGREVRFKVVDSETIFTELMAGKLDMVFCYGTSANHSTEFPPYIMSEGYCPMKGYRLIVAERNGEIK